MSARHIALAAACLGSMSCMMSAQTNETLAKYLVAQDMYRVPTSWQTILTPGSIIIVNWHAKSGNPAHPLGWKYVGKAMYATRRDVPDEAVAKPTVAGGVNDLKRQGVNLGVLLGGLSPDAAIQQMSQVTSQQVEFVSLNHDQGWAEDALAASPLTVARLQQFTSVVDGNRGFRDGNQAYMVLGSFAASEVHLTAVGSTELTLKSSPDTKVGDCLPAAPPPPPATPTAQATTTP